MRNHKYLHLAALCNILLIICSYNGTAKEPEVHHYPFRDINLSIDDRINDLIGRLTLEEKVSMMMYDSPPIKRLGIPRYNWWNESLHGVARAGRATVFPQAIGMGATFDDELIFRVSTAISDEARAMHHAAVARGNRLRYGGLTFWSPNINIFRDPRWGRGMETYGEDPYLMSRLGVAFVKGLQGNHPTYLKTAACAKHYVVHSGPEGLRHKFNAESSLKDMNETYFPAFKALVQEGRVEAIMCAYNRTNDEPCCGSHYLINEVLRERWGFEGHVVSDCWGIRDFHQGHNITSTPEESAALALRSGINLNCGNTYYPYLIEAVDLGLVREDEVDESLGILMRTLFRLGLFDPDENNPYTTISTDVINSPEHRDLALETARKSIVLLKNDNVLPLARDTRYIYVTGPNANTNEVLLGNYYGVSSRMTTILEGISGKIEPGCFIQYKKGFLLDRPNINHIDWTTGDAREADVSVVVMGLSPVLEGEEGEAIASPFRGDRLDYNLPANQIDFLRVMRQDNPKPIVAIVTGGSPMNLKEIHELADAVVLAWYPGEEGGNAVADVLFGDVNPGGRLPLTFPASIDQLPPFEDYAMTGRTYRYMTDDPMYPFGFGLSYTSFSYDNIKISNSDLKPDETAEITVRVTNTGNSPGEEVVQLYLTLPDKGYQNPLYSLKGFKRILLKPGESEEVIFELTPEMKTSVNMEGEFIIEEGDYTVRVGGASPGKRSLELGAPEFVTAVFSVKE